MRSLFTLTLWLAACAPPEGSFPAQEASSETPPHPSPPPNPNPSLELDVSSAIPGERLTWTARGLFPGETAYLVRAAALAPGGSCPPVLGGLCLDLRGPVFLLTSATANARGVATGTLNLPINLPAGGATALQVAAVRGAGGVNSVKSPALRRVFGERLGVPITDLVDGDLEITEIMTNPTAVDDRLGEWFEITNRSGVAVDLLGLTVEDDGQDRFTVDGSWFLAAGARAVLGAARDPAQNGGVPVDIAFHNLTLGDGADALVLRHAGGEIDRVAWDDGATFPDPAGASMSLDPASTDNAAGNTWCEGAPPTPGQPNPACAFCGNGVLNPGETCDDGGQLPGDGCDADCVIEACPTAELPRGRTAFSIPGYGNSAIEARRFADGDLLVWSYGWVTRIDADTQGAVWTRQVTPPNFQIVATAPTPDGGAWLVGLLDVGAYTYDAVQTIRLNATGDVVLDAFHNIYSDTWETVSDAWSTPDGGVVVTGGFVHINDTYPDGYVLKVDAAGAAQWTSVFSHNVNAGAGVHTARALSDGSIIAVGALGAAWGPSRYEVRRLSSHGGTMWTADLYWPLESFRIEDVVELAGGRLAFIGVSEDTPGDSFATVQVFSAAGSPQWDIQLRADRPVDLGTLVQHPATCAAPATHGQSCLVEDMTCANAAAQTCTCDGGAWSCSAAPPELHLIWSTPGSAHAWRQSALSWSGSPLTHHHADAALGRAVGRARVTPAGGVELPLATTTGNFEWMWTDSTLDWGCGRSPSTDVLSADFATSWAVSTINAGPASVGAWRTTSNPFLPIATALPAPVASVVCADTVCP